MLLILNTSLVNRLKIKKSVNRSRRSEKRKPRLLLHKLKAELKYLYHNHFVEFTLLPDHKTVMAKKGIIILKRKRYH